MSKRFLGFVGSVDQDKTHDGYIMVVHALGNSIGNMWLYGIFTMKNYPSQLLYEIFYMYLLLAKQYYVNDFLWVNIYIPDIKKVSLLF